VAGDPVRSPITIHDVEVALARAGLLLEGAPGPPAPRQVLGPSPEIPGADAPVTAAVLVALFEEDGEARVVLTRRSEALRSHTGQISFPGGRIDAGEGPVGAALREAWEEIGLDPSLVDPLAWLPVVSTVSSGTAVAPVVAALRAGRPPLTPSPAEVARVFDVALSELATAFTEEIWTREELGTFPVYLYDVATETVWGATGRMLTELLTLVLAGPAAG
jgi:8-oxo-dGTP pyrophosphatase MutT (NUDIX family)